MKKRFTAALCFFVCTAAGFAQSYAGGMSLSGSTGLISAPTAHVGWEENADLGIDMGYHFIGGTEELATGSRRSYTTHIPKIALSLMKTAEVSLAIDTMDNWSMPSSDPYSILLGGKLKIFRDAISTLAIGSSIQLFQDFPRGRGAAQTKNQYTSVQLYLVATIEGFFFGIPASTSVSFGKTIASEYLGADPSDLDFSVGFDLTLFPATFGNLFHWLNDFSNYSYSAGWTASGSSTNNRGSYNTGLRILPLEKGDFKLAIDMILADILDERDRSFILGATFGLALR